MSFEMPNIRHLRAFLEVARHKSISQASERVFLSQPAITQAIAKLEGLLGTSLFVRRSDGMFTTPSGEIFALRIERAINLLEMGVKEVLRTSSVKTSAAQLLAQLTTTQLRALVAVSNARNFSIAGRNLGVSQSSLHRAARELEGLVEVVLFEKTSTGISLSKAALHLSRACKLAFAEVAQGKDEIDSLHNRASGQIVVGSMPLARTSLLPDAIIAFSSDHPAFHIKVTDGPYDDLLHYLRHGDIDVIIGALRYPPPANDVEQTALFSSQVHVVARPDHPLFSLEKVTLKDLAQYGWVVPRVGTPTRTIFESAFTEAGMKVPEFLVETSSQILIRSLLLGSDRLTMISAHQIQHELEMGVLSTLPYELENAHRFIGMTVRSSWKPTDSQRLFLETLHKGGPENAL